MDYVVGAGAIGCTIAAELLSGNDGNIAVVERDVCKVDWCNRHGIVINNQPSQPANIIHFDDWRPEPGNLIFLCVKCYDNAEVLNSIPDDCPLIPIQNGYDPLLEARNPGLEGIASFVARCEPGTTRVAITRSGHLHMGWSGSGFVERDAVAYQQHAYLMTRSHYYQPRFVKDIRPFKATKLMYNAAISPLAAAAGIDNGELLTDPDVRDLFFDLLKENYSILTAANVPLGKVGPFHPRTVMKILRTPWLARLMSKYFVRSLRGTYCSMAGDIEKGRTELDNYTGHLLRLAGDSIPAPLNRAVYDVVSQLRVPDRAILKRIR